MVRLVAIAALVAAFCASPTVLYAQPRTAEEAFSENHSTTAAGFGPGFNANACITCHVEGGRGGGGPTYRSQHWTRVRGGPPVQKWRLSLTPTADLNPTEPFHFLQLIPPPLHGAALLEQIPDDQIAARHDPFDADGDGISGRVNGKCSNFAGGPCSDVGRFGAKACEATLGESIRAALAFEFGVTPEEQRDHAGHWDWRIDLLAQLPEFHALPQPRIAPGNEQKWVRGEEVFSEIGCADCHTAEPYTLPSGQQIKVYSDFLLHDMGRDLDDRISLCGDAPSEWKTRPLNPGRRFWFHDGMMNDSVRIDAIRRHGGEATSAANAWRSILNTSDAQALDVFLFSFSPIGGSSP